SGYVLKIALLVPGMIMSARVDRKYSIVLFKNDLSSPRSSAPPRGMVSTRKRTIRTPAFRMTVYGNTHRSSPDSSLPPIHPHSWPTVLRNASEAYTGRPECHAISTGAALRLFTFLALALIILNHPASVFITRRASVCALPISSLLVRNTVLTTFVRLICRMRKHKAL